MARKPREDWAGAWHHVMNRGRNRDIVFQDDEDAFTFLDIVGETCERYEIEVHAYSLMPNHYHLLVRSVHGNLSAALQYLGASYTQLYNAKNGNDGGLFRGRFKSQPILNSPYLIYVFAYIHLNPLKANLVTRLDAGSAWTGHRKYIGKSPEPKWLETNFFLSQYGSSKELEILILRLHRKAEPWPKGMTAGGWFRWSICPVDTQPTDDDNEENLVVVEEVLNQICKVCGATRRRLGQSVRGPRGNPERKFAVWALRSSTHLAYREIGEILGMSQDHVAHNIRSIKSSHPDMDTWMEQWEDL